MQRYASPRIGMAQHQGFVQGLNYFYIFFAIGKQGIAWHGEYLLVRKVISNQTGNKQVYKNM
jgi:hypothetical protein